MIVVQNHIAVRMEFHEEFERIFRERNSSLSKFKGFLYNYVLRPKDGNEYIVMTVWNSMEDFQRWVDSDDFRKAHSGSIPEGMFEGRSHLTIHDVVTVTEKSQDVQYNP